MNEINNTKKNIADNYNQLSRVSILRHLQDIVALATWHLENLFSLHKLFVQDLVDKNIPGTLGWYRDQVLKFQYGDDVEIINYRPGYAVEDEDKKIIRYAHIAENVLSGGIIVKVAKEDRTELLSNDERDALLDYVGKIKYPGTSVFLVNTVPDVMEIEIDVIVNPQLIDSTGQMIGTSFYPVQEAIIDYINGGQFGGIFVTHSFIDAIQAVEGVNQLRLKKIEASPYSQLPNSVVIFNLNEGIDLIQYEAEAGHLLIEVENLTINYQ